jgi:FKBP-type peptidyl-prolyl cis-trans isomerase
MPTRNATLAVLLLCLAPLFAGCGADDAETGDKTESTEMSNEASEALAKLQDGEGAGKEVVTTASGLSYVDLKVGDGALPEPGQTCSTHATLWLLDGTRIWSSRDSDSPFDFKLGGGGVIAGWDEGVSTMKPGGLRRLAVPGELGYGAQGRGEIPPNATLIFEIELREIH